MPENNSFELEIIRKEKSELISVEWVEVQSPTGNFVVGPDHCSLISILKDRGKFTYKKFGTQEPESFDVFGGVFKISENKASIILDL